MSTQTKSRILLTAFIGLALPPGAYFIALGGQYVYFGWFMVILVIALLLWIWRPWRWFQRDS